MKQWGRMNGKLLTGALVLCLAACVAPMEVLAEGASSESVEGETSPSGRAAGEVQTGSVNGIVEGSVTWTYDPATGETVVTGSGKRENNYGYNYGFESPFPMETESIRFERCVISGDYSCLFSGLSILKTIDFSGLTVDTVTNMGGMFGGCSGLSSLDVSGFDTGNVTNMNVMFSGCSSLSSLDVSGFDTGNVTEMESMFSGCSGLGSLDVSGFDTGKVTDMAGMFYGCSSLSSLDVSGFDTGKVTDMLVMFSGCSSLSSLDVSRFNTGNVTEMRNMFSGCSGLSSLDVSRFNTGKVTGMGSMFSGCSSLTSLDVSGFDTGNVTNMYYMFYGCSGLSSLDISGFDTGNVTRMDGMFQNCSGLKTLATPKSLGTKKTDLPGTFVDQEGNRTKVLNENFSGKLLRREDTVSEPGHCVSGTIKLSGDTTATVELSDAQGTVTATQTVTATGGTAEYRLENVPAGTYILRVRQENGVVREYAILVTDTDVSQDTQVQLLGDVNGDGTINARDKKLLFNHIEKISELSGYLFDVGDVNKDGKINARDKKMLYNHIERITLLW